jgi:tetratricopeptide (TPR) repeat protein
LKRERPKPSVSKNPKEEVPPEEDTSLATENITFNPLEAQKDITVGNQYYKKGNFRAAFNRYRLATRYDDSNTEAWLRLGEASEKVKDAEAEKEAYTKYLAAAPDAKNAAEIRKKLEKLK